MNCPDSSTSAKRAFSSSASGAYWALTSISGILDISARQFSRAPPAKNDQGDQGDENGHDAVVDVVEAALEFLPASAEREADRLEGEAPDGRADQRQHRVREEPGAEHTRRDGDEGACDWRDASEQDGKVAEALEPALGSLELPVREMEPAPVALEERPAAVDADRPTCQGSQRVTERPGQNHRHVCERVRVDWMAEEDDRLGEGAGSERPGIEHHELAESGEHRVDKHQPEHRQDAAVADEGGHLVGDRAGDRSDQHRAPV